MMSVGEQASDIKKIIFLSEKMLVEARQEDWENVTKIESQRRELITSFFSQPVHESNGQLADVIRVILEKDREIIKLGAGRREKLRSALRKINRGKTAVESYAIESYKVAV